eukprot:296495-Prorocentrum_minimum.AAC.1
MEFPEGASCPFAPVRYSSDPTCGWSASSYSHAHIDTEESPSTPVVASGRVSACQCVPTPSVANRHPPLVESAHVDSRA